MTTNAKLAVLLAAGSLVLCAAPALAASAMTERFVANVQPNVQFLDGSSRLAATASASPKLRAFARAEAGEQSAAGDRLAAWTQTNAQASQVASLDGSTILTGRSVAIDGATPIVRTPAPGTLLPSGESRMDQLARLKGRRFDGLYRSAQRDVLERLAALYSDYVANGDDPELRALAGRELPKVDQRLAQLRAL